MLLGSYVMPTDVLAVDLSTISDPDGITTAVGTDGKFGGVDETTQGTAVAYQWGTLDANGVFTNIAESAQTSTYTVPANAGGITYAVQFSFWDDARDDADTTRVKETLTSAGVKAAIVVNFNMNRYEVSESKPEKKGDRENYADIVVSLSNAPATGTTVDVEVNATGYSSALGDFTIGDEAITLPHILQFAGDPTETTKTIRFTAKPDGPGTREFTLNFGAMTAGHMAGDNAPATIAIIDSKNSPATGTVTISDTTPQVGDVLTMIVADDLADPDGIDPDAAKTYVWYVGADEKQESKDIKSYTVVNADHGMTIKASVKFTDQAGNDEEVSSAPTAAVGRVSTGRLGLISKIMPGAKGLVVSAGDKVALSVDVYGLQDAQDQKLANADGTIEWSSSAGSIASVDGTTAKVVYTAPSSPGTHTVTATVNVDDCRPKDETMRDELCSVQFDVRVRRSAPPQPEPAAPVNPPGDIPTILTDGEGEQYEVFKPVEGGTFAGEGYSIMADSGAVPNGEFIGVRMSDDGAASNMGMTHQRYTLGGNMYGVHVVDSAGTAVSDYVLEDAAKVCVPLPDMFRARISDLALVTINSDGSLTILSANVRLGNGGSASVCGNLSGLPASVAVGSMGAPDAIPTATPVPTPEPPDTGGSAPSSNGMLWALLLGTAILLLGAIVVLTTRRGGTARKSSEEAVS